MLKSWIEAQLTVSKNYPLKFSKDMPTVTILCGIPTSGKSTWTNNQVSYSLVETVSISRDDIRFELWGENYKFSKFRENLVTDVFNRKLQKAIYDQVNIIIDNTHCRDAYIHAMLTTFKNQNYLIRIKFFDIPLWKAYYRNIKRRIRCGKHKWIPFKILHQFKQNYDKINKAQYDKYAI